MRYFVKPDFMKSTGRTKPGRHWLPEILILFGVEYGGTIITSLLVSPVIAAWMMTKMDIGSLTSQGGVPDFKQTMELLQNMPGWLTAVMLLGEIGLILASFIVGCGLQKRTARSMGFTTHRLIPSYLLGMLYGALAMGAAYGICLLTGAVHCLGLDSPDSVGYLALFFAGYMVQGLAEEVVFRGYFMVSVARRYSVGSGIFLSALMFAMMHGANDGITTWAYLNLFLFGVLSSLVFLATENIWMVGALHSVWNFVQGNVFGIRVSGTSQTVSILGSEISEPLYFLNGGKFGLEGGIAVTLVLAAAIGITLAVLDRQGKWTKTRPEPEKTPDNASAFRGDLGQNREIWQEKSADPMEERPVDEEYGKDFGEVPWRPEMATRQQQQWQRMEDGQKPDGQEADVDVSHPKNTGFDRNFFSGD